MPCWCQWRLARQSSFFLNRILGRWTVCVWEAVLPQEWIRKWANPQRCSFTQCQNPVFIVAETTVYTQNYSIDMLIPKLLLSLLPFNRCVSHRKLYMKPTNKLPAAQLLMCFIYSTVGVLASFNTLMLSVLIKGFTNWLNSPKMKGSPWKGTMCRLKTCPWQLQNTPHKIFERVETWQFCDCLHGNGERVSLG